MKHFMQVKKQSFLWETIAPFGIDFLSLQILDENKEAIKEREKTQKA